MRLGTPCEARRPSRVRAVVVIVVGGVFALSGFANGVEAASPPLARYFPRQDLAAYAEFDGLDETHGALWRKTAAYRLLTETPAGVMLEKLAVQLATRIPARTFGPSNGVVGAGAGIGAADLWTLTDHLIRHGFALGVVNPPGPGRPRPSWVGVVIRGGAKGKVGDVIEALLAAGRGNRDAKPQPSPRPKGRTLQLEAEGGEGAGEAPRGAWWREGDDLVLSWLSPDGADVMIETLDGGRPNAVEHPDRVALAQSVDGFTPVGLAFADLTAFSPLPPQAAALGFDQVKRIEYRWGVHGDALTTITRVVAPAPRSGLLALFDQPGFDPDVLKAALPAGLAGMTAISTDLGAIYDRFAAGFASMNPNARASFERVELAFRNATGLRIRDDLLPQLGSKVLYFALPTRGDAAFNAVAGFAQGLLWTPRAVLVFEIKEAASFAKLVDGAVARTQGYFRDRAEANSKVPPIRIHPLKGVEHGYVASLAPTVAPLPAGFRPTWIVAGKTLIVAANPDDARTVLEQRTRAEALPAADALTVPLGRLGRGAVFARVVDDRRSLLPDLVANLPMLGQWAPVVGSGRLNMMAIQTRQLLAGRPFVVQPPGMIGGDVRVGFVGGDVVVNGRVVGGGVRTFEGVGVRTLEIDPDELPTPEQLRPYLFPSVVSLTADEKGVELRTREAFPVLNPAALAPAAAVLLAPVAQSARAAAQRSQSVNNLKQIGLAFHNFHDVKGAFPAQATYDQKTKKPLLSWRVALLPYMGETQLYNEFKHDEPWDSPHNKALIPRMPKFFVQPGVKFEPGKTHYRGFSSPMAIFDPSQKDGAGVSMQTITDGTSNTLAIVEAKEGVVWTKPEEEIAFNEAQGAAALRAVLAKVGGPSPGGFNALFVDGSVRFIKDTINPAILRALITRAGGEVVSNQAF